MRISDWSSDVCSSDLRNLEPSIANLTGIDGSRLRRASQPHNRVMIGAKITIDSGLKFCVCGADSVNSPNTLSSVLRSANRVRLDPACSTNVQKIGRESCRERVCQYV